MANWFFQSQLYQLDRSYPTYGAYLSYSSYWSYPS